MREQLFEKFHATRRNIIKIMFFIKFQEYFDKMYSCFEALRPATLLKKRLWHRCHPVNFAKFLKHLLYRTPPHDCLYFPFLFSMADFLRKDFF